jgi:N-acyl-D-amino-acid deacylase
VAEYVAATRKPAVEALSNLLAEESLAVLLVFHQGDDRLVEPFLQHPCYMMGTDGIYHEDSGIHPRQYGSATRLLGPCVRDRKLFSLEEAVYKLSGHPAQRFGLKNRGVLQEDNFADVVVFDAATVTDRAVYTAPHQLSHGIEQVVVNGRPIIRDRAPLLDLPHPLPGQALKFKQ